MIFNLDNANSNEHQLQPNSLVLHLPSSLALERPLVIHLSCQIRKEEAEAEVRRVKAEREKKGCNRLIAIILECAKSQGIKSYNLPYLKHKTYNQLCKYIQENWPELISQI